ncbi:hypothetical protein L1887_18513 [Cichorium endivia]|nr:hypothetical protein L1887_18513 [Cichorium endivia]
MSKEGEAKRLPVLELKIWQRTEEAEAGVGREEAAAADDRNLQTTETTGDGEWCPTGVVMCRCFVDSDGG